MKVIAARLSGQHYTVVRVPLRRVDANAAVAEQVQQALDQATHQRVQWADLVDHSAQTVRVVLLDGLDELLQASSTDRADYLHRVAEFQTREAALGYPVAVMVTSRTLVIDRLSLPRGVVVVKLEQFDEQRIALWVGKWNQARTDTDLPRMSARWALTHRQLAAQPLLLLMLTLYHAEHGADAVDDLSSTQLYRALFDDYAHREVTKRSGRVLHGGELAEAVQAQLHTLAVAALGMVNRSRQEITESELSADLTALEQHAPSGERLLGQFFFIHSPEAQDVASRRSYEFLHATFAEYLVAVRVVEELRDVAQSAFARRVRHTPDDDLLFALLSHQPLAVQHPVLGFADDLLASLDHDERHRIRDTLDLLLSHHQARRPSRHFADYRPTTPNTVRALAAYSANLVLLRIGRTLTGQDTMLADLFADGDPLTRWRDTLDLWKAGLDDTGFHAMLGAVDLVDGDVLAREGVRSHVPEYRELHLARLRDDRRLLSDLRLAAMMRSRSYLHLRGAPQSKADEWYDFVCAWLRAGLAADLGQLAPVTFTDCPGPLSGNQQSELVPLGLRFMAVHGHVISDKPRGLLVGWLSRQLGRFGERFEQAVSSLMKRHDTEEVSEFVRSLIAEQRLFPKFPEVPTMPYFRLVIDYVEDVNVFAVKDEYI